MRTVLIEPGKIYVHKDGGRYRVIRLGFKMKCRCTHEGDKWLKAVMYEPAEYGPDKDFGNGDCYVRSQVDFCNSFMLELQNREG